MKKLIYYGTRIVNLDRIALITRQVDGGVNFWEHETDGEATFTVPAGDGAEFLWQYLQDYSFNVPEN